MFVRLALRPLEGEQNAAPDGGRVFERLQARRERLPIVMAEIGVPGAGRQHQRIEVDGRSVIEPDASRVLVDGLDRSEQRRHVPALAQEMPDRPGDLRRRERGGRDLIEKRLKQMMIAAVDEGDADRRPGKPMNGFEPAESGADDDHVMGAGGGPRRHRLRSLAAAETPQLQTSAAARRLFSNVVRSCHSGNIGGAGSVSSTEEIYSAVMRATNSVAAGRGGRSPGRDACPVADSKILLPFYRNLCYRVLVDQKSRAWTRCPARLGDTLAGCG